MMRRAVIALAALVITATVPNTVSGKKFVDRLPARSGAPIPDFNYSFAVRLMEQMALHHIEGVWQYTDSDLEIAIIRPSACPTVSDDTDDHYLMIVLQAPNRAIRPGTVIGHISRGDKERVYNARIYSASTGSILSVPKTFTITLDSDDNTFSLRKHNSPLMVFLWRFAPYLWRYPITPEYQNITRRGCVRIYPAPTPPLEPVYL